MTDPRADHPDAETAPDRERAGIQSVEVGFALLDVLARAAGPLMLRDLAACSASKIAPASPLLLIAPLPETETLPPTIAIAR